MAFPQTFSIESLQGPEKLWYNFVWIE
ncbi:hypothetical protein JL09_g6606 [Pichia kudriavzevii]|uniref:Uncharacterized protein n=1 Tax=Pichia kudriavzevii TaxID=4909 RepID=A0A099NM68_PICKU|nr:hypothetical protein JL09_g6611 [Pichia kudriavzevii]KGK33863.1 hypothetical protein JL09_g6606 [Pichia kudriavzevii]